MKKIFILLILAIMPFCMNAQVTGTITVPGSYSDLAAAITDLNTVGISGNVIINLTAPETAPTGGYILGSAVLNASVNASNTLTINGGNNTITAFIGANLINDAVFRLAGTDYVTLNQLNIVENATNITTTTQMERGIWLCNLDAADACKNVTIQNCTVNLNGITANGVEAGILVLPDLVGGTLALTSTPSAPSAASGIPENIVIKSNTITNCYNGIYARGNSTLANYMLNLTIGGNSVADANTVSNIAGGLTTVANGIYASNVTNDNYSNNIVSTTLTGTSSAQMYGIYTLAAGGSRIINNNDVSLVNSIAANSSALYPIYNTGASTTLQMNNNNIHDCSTAGTGTSYLLYNSSSSTGLAQMNNNIVTNFTRTGAGGTFWGILNSMSGISTREVNNNSITNINYTISSTTTSTIVGLNLQGSQQLTCLTNTISGIAVTGAGTGTQTIQGISNTINTNSNHIIQENLINTISTPSTAAGSITGILNSQTSGTIILARNNINGINAQGAGVTFIKGMTSLGAGSTKIIRNNFISNLTAPAAIADNAVIGIEVTGSTNQILNNTIHLGSVSTLTGGTNFGATGFAWTSVATSVNLQNNIINVKATPSGTGIVAAMRFVTTGTTGVVPVSLATTTNNNILHAPAGTRSMLYVEGLVNAATLINPYNLTIDPNFNLSCGSTFKAFMAGRNSASATENNLVAGPGINTFIPSGSSRAQNTALVLPLVTVDFAGTTRSTTPDMGALEFTGPAGPNAAPPVITYTNIPTKVCLANPILTATITDLSGVDVSPTNAPRIYYKKTSAANAFAGNTSVDNGWKWVATTSTSNPYSFTMDYSLLQSVVVTGDTIQYFVVAQDLATTPNIGANTAFYNTGFCPSSVDLTVPAGATPITGVKSFTVIPIPSSITATPAFDTVCISGSVNLAVGAAGTITDPALVWQWQSSPIGASTWSNISGANTAAYTVALQTSSTDYQLTATCPSPQGLLGTSTVASIFNSNPIITSTTTDTICGTDTANLIATTNPPYNVAWYDSASGGSLLFNGTNFTTPFISSDKTYYAAAFGGQGKVIITEVCNFDGGTGWTTPSHPSMSTLSEWDPIELTNIGTSPVDISGWKLEVTGGNAGSTIIPAGNVIAPGGVFVIGRGSKGTSVANIYYSSAIPLSGSATALGVILSNPAAQIQDVMSYSGFAVVGTGTPAATAADWSGTTVGGSGTAGWRRTALTDNNSATDWTLSSVSNTVNYGNINVAYVTAGCFGPRIPVVVKVNPAPSITASSDTTVCWDGSVSVPMSVTSGNAGYTYSWAPALGLNTTSGASVLANPLSPTQYIVTGNDITSGCQTTDTVLVAVSPQFYDTARASLSAICAGGSVNIIAGDSVPPLPPYCVSGATLGADTKIDTMSFAGITTGSSPSAQEQYTDYTSVVIPAAAGVALPLSVRNGSSTNNHYAAYLKIWIDYDQSGTFDASELVYSFGNTTALNTIPSTTVTIPTSAFNGPTRLRLVLQESGSASTAACGTWLYGETEDYTINISGATPKPVAVYTYSWMPGSLSGASQTVSPTTTTTYIATQMNAFGCKAQDSVTITVNQPLIAATPASQSICAGVSTPASIVATGATTYTWTPTSTLTLNATNDSAMALPTSTTTYSVSGADVNGCIGTAMATVVVEALPVKDSVTATPSAVCTNGTSMLNAHFVYPKAAASYCSSNATNSADTKIDTVKFAGVITGSSPTNPETYTNNTSVVIPAAAGVPLPLQIINGSESLNHYGARVKVWIDYNQDNVFDANEMVYEFGQTTALNTIPATTVTIPTTALNGPTRMRVVFRESGSTTSTVACGTYTYGETEDYTVNISGATAPITYSYAWTPSAGVVSPTSAATSTNPIANTTTFTVTATSSGAGCVATDSVTVSVTPLSAALTTASKNTLCAGDSSQLGVTITGGGLPYSYSWSPTTGMAAGASTTQNPWVKPLTSTAFSVTVTDACNTTATSTITITVNPLPILLASASDSTVCAGDSTVLTASGADTYVWNPGSLVGAVQTVTPTLSTVYTVTGTDTVTGCTVNASVSITYYDQAYVVASATPTTAICVGDSVVLNATDSVPAIVYCPASATCDEAVNNVVFNTISNATGCSGGYSDQTAINTTVAAGTSYPIAVTTTTFYSSDQCTAWVDWNQDGDFTDAGEAFILSGGPTFSGSIGVPLTALNGSTRMRIRMTYTGVNAPCGTQSWGETEDYTVNITGGVTSPAPVYTYAWMPGSLVGATQTVSPTTNSTYTVTQTDSASGCQVKDSVSITINASPVLTVSASPNDTVCAGTNVILMSGATGAVSYTWNGASTSGMDTTLTPAITGKYTVVATSAAGCTATDSVSIVVNNPIITSLTASPLAVCTNGNSVLSVSPGLAGVLVYCTATATCDEAVNNVVFNTISNATTCSGGYSDQTTISTNINAGTSYPISVSTTNFYTGDQCAVWIDWNQNGLFTDAGENYTTTGGSASTPFAGSINVPITALNGSTRMRIRMTYTGVNAPCGVQSWGETEDYTVNVSGGVTAAPAFASVLWTPATYLSSTTASTVNATGIATNTTYTVQGTDAAGCTVTSSIVVSVNPTPTGNTYADPIIVSSLPYVDTGDNMSANCWSDAGTFTGNRASNDVFYRFTLPSCNDSVVASLCNGSNFDTYLQLLDSAGVRIAFNDDGCGTQSVINFGGLTKGAKYYVVVEGFNAAAMGTYVLDLKTYDGAVATALAAATSSQTQNQPDSSKVNYYDANCNIISTIDDGAGGNVLGMTNSTVNVGSTASFHNGQPFARRWYEITPTSNGAADVTLYFNQSDFNDLNAATTAPYMMVPTTGSNTDPNIANIRITKNDNAGLGSNPVVLTPTSVNWNGNYWEVKVTTPNFSQFRLHGVNPGNAALSVAYKTFTVIKEATSDLVEWTTVSESNNSHFNVQRSADGTNFETLGTLNTKAINGNSTNLLSYTYTDVSPMIGHNYYRLEQVDRDGKINYTKTIDIIWGAQGSVISLYPNPTKDVLNIDLSTDKISQTEIKLLDMSGRVVKSVIAQTVKGLNSLSLDMSELSAGVYGIQIYENNKMTYSSKVNKRD